MDKIKSDKLGGGVFGKIGEWGADFWYGSFENAVTQEMQKTIKRNLT